MLEVKVTSIGNSTGIILTKEVLGRLKVSKGDRLFLTETSEGYQLTPYDAKFLKQMKLAQKVMKEDRDVLHALAKA
jgi:putative addiction module antidote